MRRSSELNDFMQAANPTVCLMLAALLDEAAARTLLKLATAKLEDVQFLQGRIAGFRAIKRLIVPPVTQADTESENSYW